MKTLLTLMLLVALTPSALAFGDYGQTDTGLDYHSDSHKIVYSKDHTCLLDTANSRGGNVSCMALYKLSHREAKAYNGNNEAIRNRIKLILSAR